MRALAGLLLQVAAGIAFKDANSNGQTAKNKHIAAMKSASSLFLH